MVSEGEVQNVCVTVGEERERDIDVVFSILPISNTSGTSSKWYIMRTLFSDILLMLAASDLTSNIVSSVIPPEMSEACLELVAVEDEIVENDELFTLTVDTENSNDVVDGNVSVVVMDNDGKRCGKN